MSSLKEKAISGMMWNAVERFGSTFFLFLSNLVLARLLMPSDFGTVAMLMVFISISETIVDAGFGSALIQKKDVDEKDYSTVFIWNIFFSLFLYSILYICSPFIANFYNDSLLCNILRVQGIVIILNSFIIVQIAKLKKELNFRLIAKINLYSVVVGTIAAIICAFYGMGVWSLVVKMVLQSLIQVISYNCIVRKVFSIQFNFDRFLSMFKFGIFIFLNRLLNTLFNNIMTLIIGKFFSSSTLGYYNQGKKLEDLPRGTISSIIYNVAFSAFSIIKDDKERLCKSASSCMRCLALISTPVMMFAFIVAEPLIIVLYGEKWIPSVLYFRILCIGALVTSPLELNSEIINSIGKSKMSFNIRMFQRTIGTILMLFGVSFGMKGLLIAYVIGQLLSFFLSSLFTGKYVGYGILKQGIDILPSIIISFASVTLVYFIEYIINFNSYILNILTCLILYTIIYLLLSIVTYKSELLFIKDSLIKIIKKY